MEKSDDPSTQSTELHNVSPLSSETLPMQGLLHTTLTNLYDESYELLSAADLQINAKKVFVELSITDIKFQEIEKAIYVHVSKVNV